jgi:putative phage-type endonuclease
MLSEEDLALRRQGISATDAVIIAGVSPYGRTVHDVYLDKLGLAEPFVQSDEMAMGHRLEPVALAALAEARGLTIVRGKTEQHRIMTWVVASPDGNVLDKPGGDREAVAEAKAVGFRMAHRWGESGDPDAIPDDVRVQVTWQMTAARVKRAHVVALLGTEARFYEIEHDDDLSTALLEMCDRFRTRHVLAKVPPPIDGSAASARMVRCLFRRSTHGIIRAPVEAEAIAAAYMASQAAAHAATNALDAAKARLCAIIGDAEGIESDDWVAMWKARKGSPKWKEIATALGATPALVEQYRGEGQRVLAVRTKGLRS